MATKRILACAAVAVLLGCGDDVSPGASCSDLSICPDGQFCVDGLCQPTLTCGENTCEAGEACVEGNCVDALCQAKECEVGTLCQKGECVACPGGKVELSCSNGKDDDCDGVADCEDEDCATKTCAAGKICLEQSCSEPGCLDGVQYGDESDVDCGGACQGCPDGKKCRDADDCASKLCKNLFCAKATCDDGLKNGDESDVDCGGGCPKCAKGGACASGDDCATAFCSAGQCATAKTCQEIRASAPKAGDAVYEIDADGAGALPATRTFCLMSAEGGGWTLLQRTVWDWNDTAKLHTNYADFYGKNLGDPARGKAFRVAGKQWPALSGGKEHLFAHFARKSADGKSCAPLYYKATNGTWSVPSAGGAKITGYQQAVTLFNAPDFSTKDKGPHTACVTSYNAVPWAYASCCTTCPTFAGKYFTPARPMVSYLAKVADLGGKKVADACGGAAAVLSNGYYGLNAMEYYVR